MKRVIAVAALVAQTVSFAGIYGDLPDAKHAWSVHDWNRPKPEKVEPAPYVVMGVPSDAVVLFDGTKESFEANWCNRKGGPSAWKLGTEGDFYTEAGYVNGGPIYTREAFGDCQLHIEYRHAPDVGDFGKGPQMRGNSGVFMMGNYEVQVLESYFTSSQMEGRPGYVDNYTDGQAGAVYAENPPMVNPARKPGEWQTYDIVFHQPVWNGGNLVHPGSITVFFNGVLVQDGWPFEGQTGWCRRASRHPAESTGPLALQDHGHPVSFRNIWIRRIPSRYAETTCGGPGVKRGDVAALRHRLAGESLKFAGETDDPAEKFIRLWESYCYEPNSAVKAQIPAAEAACVAAIEAKDPRICEMRRIGAMKRFVKMLVTDGWQEAGSALEKALNAYKAPPKPKAPHLRDI